MPDFLYITARITPAQVFKPYLKALSNSLTLLNARQMKEGDPLSELELYGVCLKEVSVMSSVIVGAAFAAVLVAKWHFFAKAYSHKTTR